VTSTILIFLRGCDVIMDYCNSVKLLLGLAIHIVVQLTVAASYVDIDDIGEIRVL